MIDATSLNDFSGEEKKTISTILEAVFKAKMGAPWKREEPPIIVIWPLSSFDELVLG
jgi:hypothetical protein